MKRTIEKRRCIGRGWHESAPKLPGRSRKVKTRRKVEEFLQCKRRPEEDSSGSFSGSWPSGDLTDSCSVIVLNDSAVSELHDNLDVSVTNNGLVQQCSEDFGNKDESGGSSDLECRLAWIRRGDDGVLKKQDKSQEPLRWGKTDQGTESDEEREARLLCEMLSTCASGSKGSVIMWGV